jgi:hypothetical protein
MKFRDEAREYAKAHNQLMTKRLKRHFRAMGLEDRVYQAYNEGLDQGDRRNPRPNRYPPGRRHDAYERGLAGAIDAAMLRHHGRNR